MTQTAADQDFSLATRLGWVSFLNDCSSEVLARALPLLLTTSLGLSPTFVGAIEGSAEAVSILLKGFSGWFSDRLSSRKSLVVFGYALSFLSKFSFLAIHVPVLFGAARIFDRSGKGLRSAPRDAMVADAAILGRTGRDFGITRFLDTLGAMTGILVVLLLGLGSGPMTSESFRSVVWIAIPFGLASVLLLMFWVPRVPRAAQAKKYFSLTIPREVRTYLAIVFIFALSNSSDAFLVLRARDLGYSFREILLCFLAFNGLAALLALPVGKLSDKFGRLKFLAAGWIVYGLCYAAFGASLGKSAFAAVLCLYGAFYGFTEGVEKALLADLLPAEKRGTGFGALQVVLGVAALPASVAMGFMLSHYGAQAAFLTTAAVAVFAALALGVWGSLRTRA